MQNPNYEDEQPVTRYEKPAIVWTEHVEIADGHLGSGYSYCAGGGCTGDVAPC